MDAVVSTKFSTLCAFLALIVACADKESEVTNNIERESVEWLFEQVAESTDWNMSGPMTWGYFFYAENKADLEPVREKLTREGYSFVGYLEPGERNDEPGYFLHLERNEVHSIDTLDQRNAQLTADGERFGVRYDGMDVGPV